MTNPLPTGSPPLLRRMNSAAVLAAIRAAEGPLSRAELARATGLSKPTVNEVVELLLRARYVSESLADGGTGPRRPGPRARLLRFRGDLGHVLGIDIGANKVLALLADLNGEVVAVERRRTTALQRGSAAALLDLVRDASRSALAGGDVARRSLKAVGVGTPGVVDPSSGSVTLAPQLGGWEGLQLARLLGRSFPCPVLVDNEVRLSMLAERWRGAARGIDEAFFVQLGVGIGGGILIGGDVYRGSGGAAGEIGYLPFFDSEDGRNGAGPFEHSAGGTAFARLGRRAAAAGDGLLLELAGGDPEAIDAEVVFEAAARGDRAAEGIVAELLERLARGIASAVVILNPSTVIIGGGLSRAGAPLLDTLASRIAELVPVPPRVVLSTLGDEAVALGAVRLALQQVEGSLFEGLRMEAS